MKKNENNIGKIYSIISKKQNALSQINFNHLEPTRKITRPLKVVQHFYGYSRMETNIFSVIIKALINYKKNGQKDEDSR